MQDLNARIPLRRFSEWDPGASVMRRLAELVLADDDLLRSPLPPLSVCSDILAVEVRRIERTWERPYYVEPWDELFAPRRPEPEPLRVVR